MVHFGYKAHRVVLGINIGNRLSRELCYQRRIRLFANDKSAIEWGGLTTRGLSIEQLKPFIFLFYVTCPSRS